MKASRAVRCAGRRVVTSGLLAASLFGVAVSAHAVPALSLQASDTAVALNQDFTVDVSAQDVTDLFGYQFDVSFDPALYRVVSVDEGPFLAASGSTFFSPGTIDNISGTVSFVFDTILGDVAGVSGSGLLGTIHLSASSSASGTGSIGLDNVSAVNSSLDAIPLAPVGPVAVTVVPEPEVWLMVALGLSIMAALRRPRSSRTGRVANVG